MAFAGGKQGNGVQQNGVVVASGRGECAAAAAHAIADQLSASLGVKAADVGGLLAAVLVFVSPDFDADEFAEAIGGLLPDLAIYGCTTSGEITPEGWSEGGVVALGFRAADFTISARTIFDLASFRFEDGQMICDELQQNLRTKVPDALAGQMFGVLLIDGLCRREEAVISAIYSALENIPIVGGSAGDGLMFDKTFVIANGKTLSDAAILLLFHTHLPFELFKCDHFEPTAHKMVVTEADTEQRIVRELNAEPAATEYARVVGILERDLDAFSFATHPVLVGVGGQYYARSIQRMNIDGSLSFFCAIDEGLVLTAAHRLDPITCTKDMFSRIEAQIGEVSIYIGFDCVLKRLDAERQQVARDLSDLYRAHNVVGFNTYGEQYRSMHVNQTFTGVAIGTRK